MKPPGFAVVAALLALTSCPSERIDPLDPDGGAGGVTAPGGSHVGGGGGSEGGGPSTGGAFAGGGGAGGIAGMGGMAGAGGLGGGGAPEGGGGAVSPGDLVPDFTLLDQNPSAPSYAQPVSPRDHLERVSGWYFGHAT